MMATLGEEEEEEREFMAIFGQSLEYQKGGGHHSLLLLRLFLYSNVFQCCPRAVAVSNLLSAHN